MKRIAMAIKTKIKSQSSEGLSHEDFDETVWAFDSTESDNELFCDDFDIVIFYHKFTRNSID